MSGERLDLPLDLLCRLLLSGVAPAAAPYFRAVLLGHRELAPAENRARMQALDALRGGPCLPFELGEDERLVAHALLAPWRSGSAGNVTVFSALSLTNAGAALLDGEGHLVWRDVEPVAVTTADSWLYPATAGACAAALRSPGEDARHARLSIGKTLRLQLPVCRRSIMTLGKLHEVTASLWDREFSAQSMRRLSSCRWETSPARNELVLEVRAPEDILRFTASAELQGWLRVAGDAFGVCLRLSPLEAMHECGTVPVGGPVPESLLLHDSYAQRLTLSSPRIAEIWPFIRHHAAATRPEVMRAAVQAGLTDT
jgi:hypothetical protein